MYSSAVLPCCWQRRILSALGLALLSHVLGCSKEELSHYQRKQLVEKEAVEYLQALGGKLTEKDYFAAMPGGKARVQLVTNVVVLANAQNIDDGVFDRLKVLGRVTELDLSKTNV